MIQIYTRPLRVYILLGALAIWGILSGLSLPIALFPSGSRTIISVTIPYGSFSQRQFFEYYGKEVESNLRSMKSNGVGATSIDASYSSNWASYRIEFDWGADPQTVQKDVQSYITAKFSTADEDVRRSISVGAWKQNQGFFAVSFYSPLRSLDELHRVLEPIILPLESEISDAEEFGLFNPNRKEITLSLKPERLALHGLSTVDVQSALRESVLGLSGGNLKIADNQFQIDIKKSASTVEQLEQVLVQKPGHTPVAIRDLGDIKVSISKESQQSFRTSGVESLILFASPKEGGNIKKLSDQITARLEELKSQWPSDVEYRILVNPSEFIDQSILSVVKEVFLAALLAVIVLFFFIGSFKNVITAAIEIPLSLFMAFILMKLTGMNLNLISLGGLALSAGMNVDASVVVLENIIRHFEMHRGKLTFDAKAKIIAFAVQEVRGPIIASTIASLVVFTPLVFTHGLTNSLLGDLAKSVIFSHGLSAFVALILVPTVRLQMIAKEGVLEAHSPFETMISRIESSYARALRFFLVSKLSQGITLVALTVALPLLIYFVVPRLPTEVVGKPESDWLVFGVNSPLITTSKQLQSEYETLENDLMSKFGEKIQYTFVQLGSNNGVILARLKKKHDLQSMIESLEKEYQNSPTKFYFVDQWNPSELRLPNPPAFTADVIGGSPESRRLTASALEQFLTEKNVFDRVQTSPGTVRNRGIEINRSALAASQSSIISKYEISHLLRVATGGVYVDSIYDRRTQLPIYLRFTEGSVGKVEDLKALPIGFEGRLIPLGALAKIDLVEKPADIHRIDQRDLYQISGSMDRARKNESSERKAQAAKLLKEFKPIATDNEPPTVSEGIPDKELRSALDQLKGAVAISIFLIFLTMVLQLGDVVQALLVLVAVPLGFIGVILSLWVFGSSLSLNSGLGTILLNGIAVANSIMLVDFIQKLYAQGKDPTTATVEAASARFRPIVMTSLTTVLGMMPIALGWGEGGKILQPLGLAVCGGLWFSMIFTLFVVPALQHIYLNSRRMK